MSILFNLRSIHQRVPLRCPTNFINVRVHDFMSQRFWAAVNRKRKSQARLHVARWSSQSVNIAFSLALFNRVWNNYTLRKSLIMIRRSFPTLWATRDSDVYNIYSYAIFVNNSSFTFTWNKGWTTRGIYLCCNNEQMKCSGGGHAMNSKVNSAINSRSRKRHPS